MVGKESRECPHFWWMAGEDTEGPIGGQDRRSAQDALCLGDLISTQQVMFTSQSDVEM